MEAELKEILNDLDSLKQFLPDPSSIHMFLGLHDKTVIPIFSTSRAPLKYCVLLHILRGMGICSQQHHYLDRN
uniref:Uncharacterized protein n=1 Tax=Salix viminalis TaxID=40686 RepID=A0A6N2ME55_SALVM